MIENSVETDGQLGTWGPMRVRGPILVGLLTVILFFAGFAGWVGSAPLAGAAIAPGVVSIDTKRKAVQHLEGGIVSEIFVREGDRVDRDQVLLRLDDTRVRARISELNVRVKSVRTRLILISEEIASVSGLLEQGLARKPRLLALKRRRAELKGDIDQSGAQLTSMQDALSRTYVRAPVDGTVVGLQVHSIGGVIQGGETLLHVVPADERLTVEARADPLDIDIIHAGLQAEVRLTPYNMRDTPPIPGRVLSVSADSLIDERTGVPYYLVRIVLDAEFLEHLPDVHPTPGMPAEVMIYTGQRTAFEYIIEPFTRSFHRAFRES